MSRHRIIVLMGSKNDLSFARKIGDFLEKENFTVECQYAVSSAHKTLNLLFGKLSENEKSGDKIVYITIAGLSDALSGVVAGFSMYPVIACPPDLDSQGWAKAFSSFMTPIGVPVLLVAKPENAALAAVRIFALCDSLYQAQTERYSRQKREEVTKADREIVVRKSE